MRRELRRRQQKSMNLRSPQFWVHVQTWLPEGLSPSRLPHSVKGKGCIRRNFTLSYKFLKLEQEEDSSTWQFLFSPSSKAVVLKLLETSPPREHLAMSQRLLDCPHQEWEASSGQRLEMLANICNAQDSSHCGEVPGPIVPMLRYGGVLGNCSNKDVNLFQVLLSWHGGWMRGEN